MPSGEEIQASRAVIANVTPTQLYGRLVEGQILETLTGETPMLKKVRFRTLGCYPLTGAIESEADTLEKIIAEMLVSTTSERQGRVIDHDPSASMEKKKQEGYF